MKFIVAVCRLLVGCLFIFSGLIKANDPIGFSYKLDEYFEIFHMTFLHGLTVYMAMGICILEVFLGIVTLVGDRMKLATWLLLGLMVFFTILTGFTAVGNWFKDNPDSSITNAFEKTLGFDAVKDVTYMKDCGCFGDAIKLTPWQSFLKDVVLTLLVLVLFFHRKNITSLFKRNRSNIILAVGLLFSAGFTLWCWYFLPVKDYRPYAPGLNIRAEMTLPPGAKRDSIVTVMTYQNIKTGQSQDFGMDNYPWQDTMNWKFVSMNSKVVREGDKPKITDFYLWNDDNADVTSTVLDNPNWNLMVVCYDVTAANQSAFKKLNELTAAFDKAGLKVYGLTSSPHDILDPFRHEVSAAFPFVYADQTVLKTMIRSNPGIVLLKGGQVYGTWSSHCVPTFDKLKKIMH